MKKYLTLILLLSISFTLYAQPKADLITERFEGQPLQEVLSQLEQKYQLAFAYDEALVEGWEVNETFQAVPLSVVLKKILEPAGLDFQFQNDKAVLIAPAPKTQYRRISTMLINGQVKDAQSGAALPYATIHCGGNRGVTTDGEGNFSIPVSLLSDTLQMNVQFLGYRSQQLQLPIDDRPMKVEVALSPKVHAFEQITVLGKVPLFANSDVSNAMIFRPNSGQTLPDFVGGKDLFRQLQMLPGISAHDDLSAGIQIRGAESSENLILLDGMTLFNTGHFFGIFSAINPNIIDKVSVYKNAFPIEYGAFTAGVVEMETSELKRKQLAGGVELNLLTSNAYLHSALSDQMDLLVAGRITNQNLGNTTYFNLLNQQRTNPLVDNLSDMKLSRDQILSVRPDFRFYDLNAKWTWRLSPATFVQANFYKGYDEYEYDHKSIFKSVAFNNVFTNEKSLSEYQSWSNDGYSLILGHQWNQKLESKLTLGYSAYASERESSSSLVTISEIQGDTNAIGIKSSGFNEVKNYALNWKNTWKITDKQTLTFGYNWVRNDLDLQVQVEDSLVLNEVEQGVHQSLYAEQEAVLGDFRLKTGLRGTYYSESNDFYFSPRIQLQYGVDPNWRLKASWSLQNQFLQQLTYENRFGREINYWALADSRQDFPVANSSHFMLGFNHQKNGFEWDVEFFHNHTNGIVKQALLFPGFGNNQTVNAGSSRFWRYQGNRTNIGVDVLLKKEWSNYSSWLAYTLSKSTDRYRFINRGESIPSENDRRHQLKWINQYRLGQWDFSATYVYSSGLTYTDLDKLSEQTIRDRRNLEPEDYISRLKDYHRIDIGLKHSFKWKGLDANFGLSVFNLFNFNNVKYLQYLYSVDTSDNGSQPKGAVIGTELELLGITPNISFGIEF